MLLKRLLLFTVPLLTAGQTVQMTDLPTTSINAIVIEAGTISSPEDCFVKFRVPELLTYSPDHVFKVSGGQGECLEYCMLMKKCETFAINLNSKQCSIFSSMYVLTEARKTEDPHNVMGQKGCFNYYKNCSDIESMLATIGSVSGIVIKSLDDGLCFNAVDQYITGDGNKFRAATWNKCKTPDEWTITDIGKNSPDFLSLKVSLPGTNECLSNIFQSHAYYDILGLTTCNIDDPLQRFSLMKHEFKTCLFSLRNGSEQTDGIIDLPTPGFFRDIPFNQIGIPKLVLKELFILEKTTKSPCRIKDIKVPNGVVQNPKNLPLFLPGSKMTVRCKAGYIVEDSDSANYTTEFQAICQQNNTSYKKCSLISPEGGVIGENKQNIYQTLVVVLSVGLVFVLVSALIERNKLRNKIAKLRGQIQENQGTEFTTATTLQNLELSLRSVNITEP